MHLKRNKASVLWPVERKGTKYLVASMSKYSVPLLIAIRNMLKLASNRRDVKNMLKMGKIKINGKKANDEKLAMTLFDILSLDDKHYKLIIANRKFKLEEVNGKHAEEKTAKVIGKKMLNKNILQINLSDGRNYISREKIETGDSVIINFKTKKLEILKFKEKAKAMFISGKHIGEEGEIEKIDADNIIVKTKQARINSSLKNLIVI